MYKAGAVIGSICWHEIASMHYESNKIHCFLIRDSARSKRHGSKSIAYSFDGCKVLDLLYRYMYL